MTVTNKESLSALIDGEASEIEVHRLVREFRSDDSLAASWSIYQQVRTTVRTEQGTLGPDYHRQLFDRISQAIQEEDEHQVAVDNKSGAGPLLAGAIAIAACLVVAVFLGVQKAEKDIAPAVAENIIEPAEVLAIANEVQTAELVELDEEKQRRLRAYLNQHDRMSRMNSKPQLVNYRDRNGN